MAGCTVRRIRRRSIGDRFTVTSVATDAGNPGVMVAGVVAGQRMGEIDGRPA